jgi:hypothetical protein
MADIKNPEKWDVDDCIEDCHYSSRFCNEKEDGILVCPTSWSECEDDCRQKFSS